MSLSHIFILGAFIFIGGLGMAAIQSALGPVWSYFLPNHAVAKAAGTGIERRQALAKMHTRTPA